MNSSALLVMSLYCVKLIPSSACVPGVLTSVLRDVTSWHHADCVQFVTAELVVLQPLLTTKYCGKLINCNDWLLIENSSS